MQILNKSVPQVKHTAIFNCTKLTTHTESDRKVKRSRKTFLPLNILGLIASLLIPITAINTTVLAQQSSCNANWTYPTNLEQNIGQQYFTITFTNTSGATFNGVYAQGIPNYYNFSEVKNGDGTTVSETKNVTANNFYIEKTLQNTESVTYRILGSPTYYGVFTMQAYTTQDYNACALTNNQATVYEQGQAPQQETIPTAPIVTKTVLDNSLQLEWQAVEFADNYDVYKNSEIISDNQTAVTYLDTNITPNVEQTYSVTANNELGSSELSVPVTYTLLSTEPISFTYRDAQIITLIIVGAITVYFMKLVRFRKYD